MSRRRALRRRFGRTRIVDARKSWSVLYRGEHMGYIPAHDRAEALIIAREAAPPNWRASEIDVRDMAHAYGRSRSSVQMFRAYDPAEFTRKTSVSRRTQVPTLHDVPPSTRRFENERTREVQYVHWGHSFGDTIHRRLAGASYDELREKLRYYESTDIDDPLYSAHREAAQTIREMMRGAR